MGLHRDPHQARTPLLPILLSFSFAILFTTAGAYLDSIPSPGPEIRETRTPRSVQELFEAHLQRTAWGDADTTAPDQEQEQEGESLPI